jgi:hypothetical protein
VTKKSKLSEQCKKLFLDWIEVYVASGGKKPRAEFFRERITQLAGKSPNYWLQNRGKGSRNAAAASFEDRVELTVNAFETELKRTPQNRAYRDEALTEARSRIQAAVGTDSGTSAE